RLGDVALNCKEIGHISIVRLRPRMGISARVDQLRVNSEPLADSLNVTFQEMSNTQLLADLTRVPRVSAFVKVRRCTTDDLQVCDSRQVGDYFILNTGCEESVLLIIAKIIERQHCNALFRNRRWNRWNCASRDRRSWRADSTVPAAIANEKESAKPAERNY